MFPATTMCSECRDTGWVQERLPGGFTSSKRCRCQAGGGVGSQYGRLRLPPRFAHATFDNFSAGDYAKEPRMHQVLTAAMSKGRWFADGFPMESSKGLLFHGGSIERRTHLAVATLKRLADKGFSCLFFEYQDLLQALQSRPGDAADEREDVASQISSVDVLLIESLGERRATDWAQDTIYSIVKHRYHNKLGLLATTGLPLSEITSEPRLAMQSTSTAARFQDTLAQRIGRQCAEMLDSICNAVQVEVQVAERPVAVPSRSHG